MFIEEEKIIFVHIPKSGGTSITEVMCKEKQISHDDVLADPSKHYTLAQIYECLCDKDLNNYTIFLVIRDPFDIVYSSYNWHRYVEPDNPYRRGKSFDDYLRELSDRTANDINTDLCNNLRHWIDVPGIISLDDLVLGVTINAVPTLSNHRVQIFILRFDYLYDDWDRFKSRIGVKGSLPVSNRHTFSESSYIHRYENESQKKIVMDMFRDELIIKNSYSNLSSMTKKIWYAPNKFESYGDEEIKAVEACLRDGWIAGFGKRSLEFERRVADIFGKKHGLFVNSGSSAILLALCALDLPRGTEVLTPACGFATTVAPIIQLGLRPVFCDVHPTRYVPTVEQVKAAVTSGTKVFLIPNLIGNVPDWDKLRAAFPDILMIEDSADTLTKTPETDISTTSFYASHVITAGGVGGMVMFNDEAHLKRATMFRDWGRIGDNLEDPGERFNHCVDGIPYDWKFLYGVCGYHMKACEMNAAFGLAQLDKLDRFLATRRANIERFLENLKDTAYYTLPDDSKKPNWLAIPLQCPDRLELIHFLEENNVQTRVCFAGNITRHPAFDAFKADYDVADTIMKNGFLLGAHHGMTTDDVDYVCDLLKKFESNIKK